MYLLVHRLTAPGRALLPSPERIWAIWRNATGNAVGDATVGDISEHSDPFAKGLSGVDLFGQRWVAKHGLTVDAIDDHTAAAPLRLEFNRLKTSIEVRHTRQMGDHLPSSARTNSVPVLFTSYLRADPTVIEWARGIVSEALVDAETVRSGSTPACPRTLRRQPERHHRHRAAAKSPTSRHQSIRGCFGRRGGADRY
ncbi:MAG TPA: hypothetical protein VKA77_08260, partial [Mycobacterium sp.]|nr:hypothetical protein [Mycobacterium sp.]